MKAIDRSRKKFWKINKTTFERLDRYAFERRLKVADVVEAAVPEHMDRVSPSTKRRTVP